MPPPSIAASAAPADAAPSRLSAFSRVARHAGPGVLVAVGYMDPGNWATDIEAGSRFGYALLFVVVSCGVAAMLLQGLAMRLGIVTGHDLARAVREHYPPAATWALWALAELAIVATDLAEVLGSALAFNLLFDLPLWAGVLVTALDTVLILGLEGRGTRRIEAIVLVLVLTIAVCFALQLVFVRPDLQAVRAGLVPSLEALRQPHALYLAVGILGATIMPHNLYLHSAVVGRRAVQRGAAGPQAALRFAAIDIVASLGLATLVNVAILMLAAATFHASGFRAVASIEDAYHLLAPITGAAAAATLFGVALLASGQSATFTGTIAGQVVLEGFLDVRLPRWQRRLITRGLALAPALAGVLWLGDGAVGRLLVLTQVVLSIGLPFALFPLIRFTSDPALMGRYAVGRPTRWAAWGMFGLISAANLWLLAEFAG